MLIGNQKIGREEISILAGNDKPISNRGRAEHANHTAYFKPRWVRAKTGHAVFEQSPFCMSISCLSASRVANAILRTILHCRLTNRRRLPVIRCLRQGGIASVTRRLMCLIALINSVTLGGLFPG